SFDKDLFSRACGQTSRYGTILRAREPGVPFTAFTCGLQMPSRVEGDVLAAAFQGSMAETVEAFASQDFFDEVLLALGDGTVIATVPRPARAQPATLQLHPAKIRRLGVTNVAALLHRAGEDGKTAALPSQPDVLSAKIAGDDYRV